MELYTHARVPWTANEIQDRVRLDTLCDLCPSIEELLSLDPQLERGEFFTVWGEFQVQREILIKGVRFTFPGCIHSLQWTVTSHHYEENQILVHLTASHRELPDLVRESFDVFVEQWREGLEVAAAAGDS